MKAVGPTIKMIKSRADTKKIFLSAVLMISALASCLLSLSINEVVKYSGLSIISIILILILIKERKSVSWLIKLIR